jgi:hypothetical protein
MKVSSIDHSRIAGRPIVFDSDQFSFLGYKDPAGFFRPKHRPYQLISGEPPVRLLEKAVYVPQTNKGLPNGCLYDNDLIRVDDSCTVRGTNDRVLNLDEKKLRIRRDDLPIFEGSVLYLGQINKHYGHFLTESLTRAWALNGGSFEGAPLLVHARDATIFELPYIKRCFAALGIKQEQLLMFDRPTIVRQVTLPITSRQANSHIYEAYKDTTHRIASEYLPINGSRTDQPLYVSRTLLRDSKRMHEDEEKIEAYFKSRGARILHPQLLTLEQQVEAFNRHKVIVGITGSAMHNIVFSMSPVVSVQFCGAWIFPVFFLNDACFRTRATYCRAIIGPEHQKLSRLTLWTRKRIAEFANRSPFEIVRRLQDFDINYRIDHVRAIDYVKELGILA